MVFVNLCHNDSPVQFDLLFSAYLLSHLFTLAFILNWSTIVSLAAVSMVLVISNLAYFWSFISEFHLSGTTYSLPLHLQCSAIFLNSTSYAVMDPPFPYSFVEDFFFYWCWDALQSVMFLTQNVLAYIYCMYLLALQSWILRAFVKSFSFLMNYLLYHV